MKLSKKTLQILKNYSSLNSGILFKPGKILNTRTVNGVAYSEAEIEDTITDEFGIYDLNNFLTLIDLMGDASINLDPSSQELVITNGKSTLLYPTANPSSIVFPKKRLEFPTAEVIFELKSELLTEINRVARAMGADVLVFESEDGNIALKLYNMKVDASLKKAMYSVSVGTLPSGNFKAVIKMENIKMLDSDYTVLVTSAGPGIAKFESTELGLSYIYALETKSEFDL